MVVHVHRGPLEQRVGGLFVFDVDLQARVADQDPKPQASQWAGRRGAKCGSPPWSRNPPKPATAAIQVPATDAM